MRTARKKILDLLPLFLLWAMLSVLVWGFVFSRITDTDRAHKLVLCVDVPVPGEREMALEIKNGAGEGIRLVRVRPFTYAMMDGRTILEADLYLIAQERLGQYADWLLPLPESLLSAGRTVEWDGVPLGVLVRDGRSGGGLYPGWIQYEEQKDYCLCLGRRSLHVRGTEGAVDTEAEAAALRLLIIAEPNRKDD